MAEEHHSRVPTMLLSFAGITTSSLSVVLCLPMEPRDQEPV